MDKVVLAFILLFYSVKPLQSQRMKLHVITECSM